MWSFVFLGYSTQVDNKKALAVQGYLVENSQSRVGYSGKTNTVKSDPVKQINKSNITDSLLNELGYNPDKLDKLRIRIVAHDGPIWSNCSESYAQGLAVDLMQHSSCVPIRVETKNDCLVVYNWQNFALPKTSKGNTLAVLAHEIGHCLYWVKGEHKGFTSEVASLRPELAKLSYKEQNEIIADDYMICRHGANTNWGKSSYYAKFRVDKPSEKTCRSLDYIYQKFFHEVYI